MYLQVNLATYQHSTFDYNYSSHAYAERGLGRYLARSIYLLVARLRSKYAPSYRILCLGPVA